MKPLILTGWLIPDFIEADFADLAVSFFFHFIWGKLPSPDELTAYLGARTSDDSPAAVAIGRTLQVVGGRAKTKIFGI
jgi:hypothetical protein